MKRLIIIGLFHNSKLKFVMEDPISLNEELPHKYESYSSSVPAESSNTLDEPIVTTIVMHR